MSYISLFSLFQVMFLWGAIRILEFVKFYPCSVKSTISTTGVAPFHYWPFRNRICGSLDRQHKMKLTGHVK